VTNVLRNASAKICLREGWGRDESVGIRGTPLSTVWPKGQIRLPILFVFRGEIARLAKWIIFLKNRRHGQQGARTR
jgi:hypothetical protein